ncbi:MAG: hypothetical protein LBK03_00160 [Bacteroidales bacterium]|jgi:hypothetical protein|nr:hypothetical protein [Bacteroidales bacterium]
MKKVISIVIVAIALVTISCNKETTEKTVSNVLTEQTQPTVEKAKQLVFEIWWDEWGRKKKNCDGAGLCNFHISLRIEEIKEENHTILYYGDDNEEGRMYADILIDNYFQFDEEGTDFYIDEDLYSQDQYGQLYMIPAGQYRFNKGLGKLGGYTIPVIAVKK